MLTAKKAKMMCYIERKKNERKTRKNVRKEILFVDKLIKDEIKEGYKQFSTQRLLKDITIESLKKRGFTVENANGKWGNRFIIKWDSESQDEGGGGDE